MKQQLTRRRFLAQTAGIGIGCSLATGTALALFSSGRIYIPNTSKIPVFKRGGKELFVDGVMIAQAHGVQRKTHLAEKLKQPVLKADMPWEQGDDYNGKKDRRIYIYGTVLKDGDSGTFRMWYNRLINNYYAFSSDGIHWQRPNLGLLGENNLINLFDFHSPSIILDTFETDPAKRYKAIGCVKRKFREEEILLLKSKFKNFDWYKGKSAYCAAYSPDGISWNLYPQPILLTGDTITFAQDPESGEYLAFHKISRYPRVNGRQVFLSFSKDMLNWSEPEPVMVTDETDHQYARQLKGGTHSEFYNMSAFPYGSQWLGLVTLFRRTGQPPVLKGSGQSNDDGPIEVQLVHSRDGRKWERCSDRSPAIAIGPHYYDSGSILGVCNSPVIVGDEMWMYYTAMTTTHGGYLPDKELSIARAAWRLDGMVSMQACKMEGVIETIPFSPEGSHLFVNANVKKGNIAIEVLDINGNVIKGYEKNISKISKKDGIKLPVQWDDSAKLPDGVPIKLRLYLRNGDLFSYTIE